MSGRWPQKGGETVSEFIVVVKKDYVKRNGKEKTVYGQMKVEAESHEAAIKYVEDLMVWKDHGDGKGFSTLQTIDPRIEWEKDYQKLADKGWQYVDYSFEIVKEVVEDNQGA